MQYCTKSEVNPTNILEAITKNREISAFLVLQIQVADTVET